MQVSKEDLPLPEQLVLGLQRLLDLDDHVRNIIDLFCGGQDLGTLGHIFLIGEAAQKTGVILHIYLMTGTDEGVNTGGSQTHTALLCLDLLRTTDTHK